jgi:transcriptional regulator with PAS, ATPase and Fis domain
VRVIAATSQNLTELIAAGKFRSDLYYRLNVLPIVLPPLRERASDIDALCEHLLEMIAQRTGMPQRELNASARALLAAYSWPGNVRELRNVLEQAGMLTDNQILDAKDFAAILPNVKPKINPAAVIDPGVVSTEGLTLAQVVADAEKKLIEAALQSARGNKALVARRLGISRGTLYQKILEFHLMSD